MNPTGPIPNLDDNTIIALIHDLYGLEVRVEPLPSERDQNVKLIADNGMNYVFKVANAAEDSAFLSAQNQVLAHIAANSSDLSFTCPQVIAAKSGLLIPEIESQGMRHFVRLVSFIEGTPLAKVRRHTAPLLEDLGRCVGELDHLLLDIDHLALHRDLSWNMANALEVVSKYRSLITEVSLGSFIDRFVADFKNDAQPLLPELRRSVIHNDINDYNVLVGGGYDLFTKNQRVAGLLDFGDMVYSYTVADLAITIAYAILDKPDPLATALPIVRGYHAVCPLHADEIQVLFSLIKMRLCVSVCMAAYQQQQHPENSYLGISQQPIRTILPKLAAVAPRFAMATFRHACGMTAVPSRRHVCNWLSRPAQTFSPVMDVDLRSEPLVVFDLSVASPLIHGDSVQNQEPLLTQRLSEKMTNAGARVGIGRYDETRLIDTDMTLASGAGLTDERHSVHLGIDLFAEAGTPVYAPLAGSVHALANHSEGGDGSPVIILRHETGDGVPFFTLYRYLSESSLADLVEEQPVQAGAQIGTLATPAINGGITPHLHFQLITDLLDLGVDFPGVCRASERHLWHEFSPDPTMILQIPLEQFPALQPEKQKTLEQRRRITGRNLSLGYRDPLKIVRGYMQYLYDETGRRYLDAYNNVPHVGHCHPRIVEAATKQMKILNTNTRYLHDTLIDYAERLISTLPDPLNVCFFVNSGSEANELALRLARAYTGQRDMIVLEGAYHGHTTSLIDISPYKHDGPGGLGAPDWVHTVPVADVYRGLYKADDPDAGLKYADYVKRSGERLKARDRGLAGFIAETCPSVGGQIMFPQGYLPAAYAHVRDAGGLCIADEVQTGYGRIGLHFYAFEMYGVVPDIVVLGKPIGNGHPLAAVVTSPEIASSFDNGMEFFSTFGGNTVSCAVGLAVLETVLAENLQAHALEVGNYLLENMYPFIERHPLVGDVRGSGLFLGIELVRDRATLEPAGDEASYVANRMREEGILLGTDGPYHNVIKIRPPMPFSIDDADLLLTALDGILSELSQLSP